LKVLHIITGLVQGGAEAVLYRVVTATSPGIEHIVVSLIDSGYYGDLFRQRGVPVHALNMPRGRLSWNGMRELYRIIRSSHPDVVQTWMYHANLIGGLVARMAGVRSIVWGIHAATLDRRYDKFGTRVVGWLCAVFSSVLPTVTLFVSRESMDAHRAMGFRTPMEIVVFNGIDLVQFNIDRSQGQRIRAEWGIRSGERVVGFVARWDPYKDHPNLLRALAILAGESIPFRLVLAGMGMDSHNAELSALVGQYGLDKHVILAGARPDVPAIMNALDLHVLSSAGEAFGNVTLEAMACGTPCVSTDVGSAKSLVGDTGWVVQPRDALSLAEGIKAAFRALDERGKEAIGKACRARVAERFSLDAMAQAYSNVWRDAQSGGTVLS
jgi:glycosyltransferase involved in cell wall biosynthesis